MSLSNEDVLEILALLDASGFDELRLETERYKLYLRRPGAPVSPSTPAAPAAPAAPASGAVPEHAARGAATPSREGLIEVISPMVGVFYRAPKPGERPFVEVGAAVEETTVVGIVEVMKLMNSVAAGKRGTVVELPVADGELVQYGTVLARIAPAGEGS